MSKYQKDMGEAHLHAWFGLSYASFLVLPRVMMKDMPDKWKWEMAQLLKEFSDTFPECKESECCFTVRSTDFNNKMVKMPDWLKNYRYPNKNELNRVRGKNDK